MEPESFLRRVAAPVPLPRTREGTKKSQTEQNSGRASLRHILQEVRRTGEDQLVLSHLSMIDIASQIENAHMVKAVVVEQVAPETHDNCAKSVVRISAFTFQRPNGRLQGFRAGVALIRIRE